MQKNNVKINNKNILLIQKIMAIVLIIPLSLYGFYLNYYNPLILTPIIMGMYATFVLFVLIIDKINHNKAVKVVLLFTFIFYIFDYYRGYTFDQKPPAICIYISSAITIILVILYLIGYNKK